MKNLLSLIVILLIAGCCNDDGIEEPVNLLLVTDMELNDIGRVSYEPRFEATLMDDSDVCKVELTTIHIRVGDSLESVGAVQHGNDLIIEVTTSPYVWDCLDSCMTIHDLSFNLSSLRPRDYNVRLSINGNCDRKDGEDFCEFPFTLN